MSSPRPPLVFDTTCLSHFARADRLDVLHDLLVGYECHTTQVVREEIRSGLTAYPRLRDALELDWLHVARMDGLAEIGRFVVWAQRVGAGERHLGEASVLAVAQTLGGTAIIDERHAVEVGRAHGIDVHGTLWLLATACLTGKLTEAAACNTVDSLAATGMRLPCTGSSFPGFSRRHGLL